MPQSSIKNRVYDTLCRWIIDGTLGPGERIQDGEIAEYFAVSRTPVREAFLLLQRQGLVEIRPGRGTYVTMMKREDISSVYPLMEQLLISVLGLYKQSIPEKDLLTLQLINEDLLRFTKEKNLFESLIAKVRFYQHLCKLSKNPYLFSLWDDLSPLFLYNEYRSSRSLKSFSIGYQSNYCVIRALLNGDIYQAQREMQKAWEQLKNE